MGSFLDDLRSSFRQSADGLGETFSGFGTDGIRRFPRKVLGWFKDLPVVPKLVLVGLVVLVLLVFLSPVAMIVAGLLFGVSIIALIIRVAQKGSIKNWGMVAIGSVVLMFTFGLMSDALYGIRFMGSSGPIGSSGGSDRSGGATDVAYDVVSEEVNTDGNPSYYVVSSANDLESLNVVAQEIQRELLQTNQGSVTFFDNRAAAESVDLEAMVGLAFLFLDEMQVRSHYADGTVPLSSEEVEQVVDAMAGNGYVQTSVEGGDSLPVMPDFMYEPVDSSSATSSSSASSTASPSVSDDNRVSFTGEVFGYPETFNYDGLSVTGQVVDWNGNHVMILLDPWQGNRVHLGFPGQQITVHGEYRGTVTTSSGGTYEAVMADDVETAE
ncbi:hypothetical protein GBA63_09060 [Rubrobacter tropicus]|uniref:Uncharacterized protein n=1 Tax=Rubrobacter tropicus TaxID=2653851 RepID=A0A6G8Q8I3_9ACTN|nr:hypothetical protein [Rubrobacter tropicus]QIN82781.1 hypothetical protein GBA63_09060 [Rubrobacter tropicus]